MAPRPARRVDPDGFEEADLAGLPPMTKDDLMANWDRVVTDRRLTLELVEGHLAGLEADAYLFGEFHAVASGGSSGRRGIFVFGWRAWATADAASCGRPCWTGRSPRSWLPSRCGWP